MPIQATPQAAQGVAPQPPAPQAVMPQTSLSVSPTASAAEIYQALRAQRRELVNQREALEDMRRELVSQMRGGTLSETDRTGLDQRIAQTDQQIVAKQIAIAESEASVATAAAVPGAAVEPPRPPSDSYEEMFGFSLFVFTVLAIPIVLAWTRRIWRKSSTVLTLPVDLTDRLGSIERSVDSVAVEVERIGEGQRFVTQLLAERAGAAGRLAAAADERQL